jgi:hypothetical protein
MKQTLLTLHKYSSSSSSSTRAAQTAEPSLQLRATSWTKSQHLLTLRKQALLTQHPPRIPCNSSWCPTDTEPGESETIHLHIHTSKFLDKISSALPTLVVTKTGSANHLANWHKQKTCRQNHKTAIQTWLYGCHRENMLQPKLN